jgi:hypothetical protein
MLTQKVPLNPARDRERTGISDNSIVSNQAGTTGMNERSLVLLNQGHKDHALTFLRRIPNTEVAALGGIDPEPIVVSTEVSNFVRFTTPVSR